MTSIQLRALKHARKTIGEYDSFNIRRAIGETLADQCVEDSARKAVIAAFDAFAQKEGERLREANIWLDDLIKDAQSENK